MPGGARPGDPRIARLTNVAEYVAACGDEGRRLLVPLLEHMRTAHPGWEEQLAYQIPTFKRGKQYVAFSVAKAHLAVHSLDFEEIAAARDAFPHAGFGKGCVKVPFDEPAPLARLTALCDRLVARSETAA